MLDGECLAQLHTPSVSVMHMHMCVSGFEVVLISSGVDVFLGAEKLNSSSEDQETDNTPIT